MDELLRITFVGHVSKDINKTPADTKTIPGGGVLYGSIAAARLGAESIAVTKFAREDEHLFEIIPQSGVVLQRLDSRTTTSIENIYKSSNSDERESRVISLAESFKKSDVEDIKSEAIVINPLWHGEFPERLLSVVREGTDLLIGDAQGFLRNVKEDGKMVYTIWEERFEYMKMFDIFKVDAKEARTLTGKTDILEACKEIREMGVKIVLLTHKNGICVYNGQRMYGAPFRTWTLEGRTGRGDTCTAAFVVGLKKYPLQKATELAARITSEKMQYAGPYLGQNHV